MFTDTAIAVVLGLVILAWACVIIVRGAGHQFPTAYTLLKDSPEIARREWIAIRGLVVLGLVFVLLLLTQLF
jgi:hypothetical protein